MSKDKSKIAKNLLKITKEKPYIFNGDGSDIDFIEVAKNYPTFFMLTDSAIFSKVQLREFWENEIFLLFEFSNKEDIYISELVRVGLKSFIKKYKTKHPYFESEDVFSKWHGLKYHNEIDDLLNQKSFFVDDIKLEDENFTFPSESFNIKWNKKVKKRFHKEAIKILLMTKNKELSIKLLFHKLQTLDVYDKEMPYSINDLRSKIAKHKSSLLLEADNVKLTNFLDEPKSSLKKVRLKFSEITTNKYYQNTGILALTIGPKDFPLEEAKSYLQLRDYLFITATENASEYVKNIFDFSRIEDDSALINNLLSVYIQDEEIDSKLIKETVEMLKEQVQYSYYPMEFEKAEEFADYLKIELAPIFNFEEFTGNLFYRTIKRKIEKFTKRLSELKMGNEKNSEEVEL